MNKPFEPPEGSESWTREQLVEYTTAEMRRLAKEAPIVSEAMTRAAADGTTEKVLRLAQAIHDVEELATGLDLKDAMLALELAYVSFETDEYMGAYLRRATNDE